MELLTDLAPPTKRFRRAAAAIRPGVRAMLDGLEQQPAYVVGARTEVLAWNACADALFGFEDTDLEERTLAHLVFACPASRTLFADWDGQADDVVATLLREASDRLGDVALHELIEDLRATSEDFELRWSLPGAPDRAHGVLLLEPAVVGPIELTWETLALPGDDRTLVVCTPEAGSASAQRLRLLTSGWEPGRRVLHVVA